MARPPSSFDLKLLSLSWGLFFGGFAVTVAVDYVLRSADGNVRTGGLPRSIWFGLHLVLGAAALPIALRATLPLQRSWLRSLAMLVQLAIGFVVYMALCLVYTIGARIDFF